MLHFAALALLGSLLGQAGFGVQDDAKAREEEAKKKIAEFRKAFSRAKPEEKPGCIDTLGETQHPKILDELLKLLTTGDKECRRAAAKCVGRYSKDQKAAEGLVKAAKSNREPEVVREMLANAGSVGFKGVVKELVPFFRNTVLDISLAAVDAVGNLKTKDGIPGLLDLLQELDAIRDDSGAGGAAPGPGAPGGAPAPGGPGAVDEKVKRKRDLTPVTIFALRNITGEDLITSKEWSAWWAKNAKTFKDRE